MRNKEALKQVRLYQKEHGILRLLVMRKNMGKPKNEGTVSDITGRHPFVDGFATERSSIERHGTFSSG